MRSLLEGLAVLSRPRLRSDIHHRFTLRLPSVRPGCVWIHASSVGEAQAAIALGEKVRGPVFITCDTPRDATPPKDGLCEHPGATQAFVPSIIHGS